MILSLTVWVFTALAFHFPPAPRAHHEQQGVEKPAPRNSPARVHPELRARLSPARAVT